MGLIFFFYYEFYFNVLSSFYQWKQRLEEEIKVKQIMAFFIGL